MKTSISEWLYLIGAAMAAFYAVVMAIDGVQSSKKASDIDPKYRAEAAGEIVISVLLFALAFWLARP